MTGILFFRLLSGLSMLVAFAFASLSLEGFRETLPRLSCSTLFLETVPWVAASLVLVSLVGPLRVGFGRLMIPAEIRDMLRALGTGQLVGGITLLFVGLSAPGTHQALALALCSLAMVEISLLAFLRLSFRLPRTFLMSEMWAIFRSAQIFGKAQESIANREFRKWSGGVRAGVKLHVKAPDCEVFDLEGRASRLSDYWGGELPVVLNFASYSCPHHRQRLPELAELASRYELKGVRFITVYIAEAHPEDAWRLEGQYLNDEEYNGKPEDFCFFQAKSLEDRIAMAEFFVKTKRPPTKVLVDSMSNDALKLYNAWPIRLYVIHRGRVVYTGEQGPFGYAPLELDGILAEQLASSTSPTAQN